MCVEEGPKVMKRQNLVNIQRIQIPKVSFCCFNLSLIEGLGQV